MKIVIPFINEMWNYLSENFENYRRYDVVRKKALLQHATAETSGMVEKMMSQIMYGEIIAYSYDNYNIIKGDAVPDVIFVLKLKRGVEFDKDMFLINPGLKIKKIGRWVIIEKDWTEDVSAFEAQLQLEKSQRVAPGGII